MRGAWRTAPDFSADLFRRLYLSIANCLDKIGNERYKYSLKRNRRAWPAAGREKPRLFENLPDHNPRRELKREEHFLIFIDRNPLKRLDSKK
jgi:hypothetical protein